MVTYYKRSTFALQNYIFIKTKINNYLCFRNLTQFISCPYSKFGRM